MLVLGAFPALLFADDVDVSKLPPPASAKIDFTRDIKPILESSCLRCHGPEKSKSGFRLDNRAAALKGGDKGVDIIAGNSTKSPLIHYVANLVADMEMPPVGKGTNLTSAQIALFRAWIDQGVVWVAATPTNELVISPIFGTTAVNGNYHKFREQHWQKEGLNGGIEQFESFEQIGPDTRVLITGHALLDDYKITLSADRNELGFIHSGWEQYRKYFDDTGGYYPAAGAPATSSLDRDLHLDIGKAWIDFGLTLPNWPRMVLGYEYDYKKGNEYSTSWGEGPLSPPNIAPVSKFLDEGVQVIKFDLDHELYGVTIEEKFRGEFYRLTTQHSNVDARSSVTENVGEGTTYFQGANTLRLEKKFTDWFFGSTGYLYSKLNSDATFVDAFSNGQVAAAPQISLERESHVFNLNGLFGPFDGLTLSTGAQSEWTREQGFGGSGATLNQINSQGPFAVLPVVSPTTLSSDYDQSSITESAALRYTKIAYTVLFAEARLEQQRIGENENDFQPGNNNYLQNTEFTSQMSDLRFGFSTSPWQSVSLSAHYRRYEDESRYHNAANSLPPNGYPGFLRARDVLTDEVEAKLVLRPCTWLKTTLSYQYLNTDYRNDTDPLTGTFSPGGEVLSGQSNSKIYSINVVLTPWRRLYLSTSFSYQPSTTVTADNGNASIAPYRGNIYTVNGNATYVFNETADLFASYSFSEADFAQNNFAAGLPVGLEFQQHSVQVGVMRRFTKNVSAKLLYSFNSYNDPSSGGALNYNAHTLLGALTLKLP